MPANVFSNRSILTAALLLFVLFTTTDARADHSDGRCPEHATLLSHVESGLPPVVAVSQVEGRAVARGTSVQLFTIDLADQPLPATAVTFSLERDQRLRLEILDHDGNLVRTVAEGLWAEGRHQLAWQHDDEAGERLTEGHFFVRLVTEAAGETVALAR